MLPEKLTSIWCGGLHQVRLSQLLMWKHHIVLIYWYDSRFYLCTFSVRQWFHNRSYLAHWMLVGCNGAWVLTWVVQGSNGFWAPFAHSNGKLDFMARPSQATLLSFGWKRCEWKPNHLVSWGYGMDCELHRWHEVCDHSLSVREYGLTIPA